MTESLKNHNSNRIVADGEQSLIETEAGLDIINQYMQQIVNAHQEYVEKHTKLTNKLRDHREARKKKKT